MFYTGPYLPDTCAGYFWGLIQGYKVRHDPCKPVPPDAELRGYGFDLSVVYLVWRVWS